MKNRTKVLIGLVVLGAGAGAWLWWSRPSTPTDVPIETFTVETRSLEDIIEVAGHLKARDEQEIRAPQAGMVTAVYVKEGQQVALGTPLASLDTLEQEQALADLAYQIDQEKFAGNQRRVSLLEGKAAVLRRALDDQTLRAHINGRVSRLDLKAGDVVKAGDTYGRIIDVTGLTATVEVAEGDIPRARVGQGVEFRFAALPGLVVKGRVASFPTEARINDRGLTVLDARLVIDAPPPELLPAFSFQAVIQVGPPREVLVVDSRAVVYESGRPRVERQRGAEWETVEVETEGFGSNLVRVVSGCQAGDILRQPAGKS